MGADVLAMQGATTSARSWFHDIYYAELEWFIAAQ